MDLYGPIENFENLYGPLGMGPLDTERKIKETLLSSNKLVTLTVSKATKIVLLNETH